MKLAGEYVFEAGVQDVWDALLDPAVLAAVMPGCEKLELVDGSYLGEIKVKVGPISGKFSGKVDLLEKVPPTSYRMLVDGRGAQGFVKANATVELVAEGSATRIRYDADAQVGGKIASVGQRLVETAARAIVKESLENLSENIKIRMAALGPSTPAPIPQPEPQPEPEPAPIPEPKPEPAPIPEPKPEPDPVHEPEPEPEPVRAPEPEPEPVRDPEPEPAPIRDPEPAPVPTAPPAPALAAPLRARARAGHRVQARRPEEDGAGRGQGGRQVAAAVHRPHGGRDCPDHLPRGALTAARVTRRAIRHALGDLPTEVAPGYRPIAATDTPPGRVPCGPARCGPASGSACRHGIGFAMRQTFARRWVCPSPSSRPLASCPLFAL
ncbi:MAG: carbon monoxide dehydrogenase subunit G [Myxococcota bacterium]